METEIINQLKTFVVFIVDGLLIGIGFDFFRILRKSFNTSDFVTYIEDVLFWIISGIILVYSIFIFNNGNIRIYMFLAILIGICIYILLFSKTIISICIRIISIIKIFVIKLKNIIYYPFNFILNIVKKIFIRPVNFIFINFKKISSKKNNLCLKILKNMTLSRKKEGKQL